MVKLSKRLSKALRGGQKGFTLIELLIVVAILGILAAVIIPNVSSFMTTGRLNAANTEAENVKTAALAFYAETGDWPVDTMDITPTSFKNFITGTLNAEYSFDASGRLDGVEDPLTATGFVPDAGGLSSDWTGIKFAGAAGEMKWTR